jgi:hypothetical protein
MISPLLRNVSALAEQMKGLARQAHTEYSAEVDAVIRSQSCDIQRIERMLDGMLGFCFDPDMLLLFKKLCRHYYTIDPAATAFYVHAYRDMWDSERDVGEDGEPAKAVKSCASMREVCRE